ncbi:MAG: exo-alpha-sialidase [Chlamydiae bacterium]|nr:exo-alpha-sialidase [Chlamydiota bacterium]
MQNLSIRSLLSIFLLSLLSADLTIIPGPLVNITTDQSVGSIVIVSGNDSGYMATWQNTNGAGIEGFSSNLGKNWTKNTLIDPTIENLWVASNSSGFLTTFVSSDSEFLGNAYTRFSPTSGTTWSEPFNLSNNDTVAPFSLSTANETGFLTTWWNFCPGYGNVNFSLNGLGWQPTITLSNTGNISSPLLSSGSTNGFMVVWQEYLNGEVTAYISYSADGTNWNSPHAVSEIINLGEFRLISIASSPEGYLLAWIDDADTSYSIFSSDNGISWTAPSQISTDHPSNCNRPFVSITKTSAGFLASWTGHLGEALASLSDDNGSTWQTPVVLNRRGNYVMRNVLYTTVAASSLNEGCMFTWLDENENVISCYAILAESIQPVTNLHGKHLLNKFANCQEYVNSLSWTASIWPFAKNTLVYRNGLLIATLPSSQTTYQDHNQNNPVTYTLMTIDESGNESAPVSISL